MGYESKFFAVRDYGFPEEGGLHHSQIIATLDMCKMGDTDGFLDLFSVETPFTLFLYDYNPDTKEEGYMYVHEDKYGDVLKYIPNEDIDEAIDYIKQASKRDTYWRYKLLIDFLKTFKKYKNIYIVHYGY